MKGRTIWNVSTEDTPNLRNFLNDHFREKLKQAREQQAELSFWLVWNPAGRQPMVKHPTEVVARAEAERLARKHPGEMFHVLKSVDTCCLTDIVWASECESEITL